MPLKYCQYREESREGWGEAWQEFNDEQKENMGMVFIYG